MLSGSECEHLLCGHINALPLATALFLSAVYWLRITTLARVFTAGALRCGNALEEKRVWAANKAFLRDANLKCMTDKKNAVRRKGRD